MKTRATGGRGLLRDARGAVLAEFVIAILPILTAFLCFVQLGHLATAKLVMQHGAIVGARAAAVITNGKGDNPGQPDGVHADVVAQGVDLAMYAWTRSQKLTDLSVEITDYSSPADPYGEVDVKIEARYHCDVPLGWLICGGRTVTMTETKKMPHQGAVYL